MHTFANENKIIAMKAEGFEEISMNTMLNPLSSTVKKAKRKAIKNLKAKCSDADGKIIGEIETYLYRYDSGIMGAIVIANGKCEIKE